MLYQLPIRSSQMPANELHLHASIFAQSSPLACPSRRTWQTCAAPKAEVLTRLTAYRETALELVVLNLQNTRWRVIQTVLPVGPGSALLKACGTRHRSCCSPCSPCSLFGLPIYGKRIEKAAVANQSPQSNHNSVTHTMSWDHTSATPVPGTLICYLCLRTRGRRAPKR